MAKGYRKLRIKPGLPEKAAWNKKRDAAIAKALEQAKQSDMPDKKEAGHA